MRDVPWADWARHAVPDARMRAALEIHLSGSRRTRTRPPSSQRGRGARSACGSAQGPGVEYLDGGWATLVAGAADAARTAGVELPQACEASHVRILRGRSRWPLALEGAPPWRAGRWSSRRGRRHGRVDLSPRRTWHRGLAAPCRQRRRVSTSALSSGLPPGGGRRSRSASTAPFTFQCTSRTARVAPEGAALVSTLKYLAPGQPSDRARDRAELESWLDLAAAGLACADRQHAVPSLDGRDERHRHRRPGRGTRRERPGPRVPDSPGVFVVGDWVGARGTCSSTRRSRAPKPRRAPSRGTQGWQRWPNGPTMRARSMTTTRTSLVADAFPCNRPRAAALGAGVPHDGEPRPTRTTWSRTHSRGPLPTHPLAWTSRSDRGSCGSP